MERMKHNRVIELLRRIWWKVDAKSPKEEREFKEALEFAEECVLRDKRTNSK